MEKETEEDPCKKLPPPTISSPSWEDIKDKDWEIFICEMMNEVYENQMRIYDIITCYAKGYKNE